MLYRPRDPVPRSLRWLLGVPARACLLRRGVGTGGGSVGGAKFPSRDFEQAGRSSGARPGGLSVHARSGRVDAPNL